MSAPPGAPTDPAAAAAAQHEMEVAQKQGQAIVIWTVGMFCIMSWEWLACLPKEVNRIWKRKFTYISYLYLANRYYGLVQFALVIPLLVDAFTPAQCLQIFRWQPVGAMLTTLLCQFILGARVYALYSQSIIVLGLLGTVYLAEFGIMAFTLTLVFPAPAPAPGVAVPCVAIGPTKWLITFWAMPLAFDTLTFLLTAYKSFTYWRMEVSTPMLTILFRDGLIYFSAIFGMNLLNVILFTTMPPTLQAINLPATAMLGIVMSCRLVLNVRGPMKNMNTGPSYRTTHTGTGITLAPSTTAASYAMRDIGKSEEGGVVMLPATSDVDMSTSYRASSENGGYYPQSGAKDVNW